MPNETPIYAWRLASSDGTSVYQKTPQDVGVPYSLPFGDMPGRLRPIRAGCYGFHASLDPLDALAYGTCAFIERVRIGGTVDTSALGRGIDASCLGRTTDTDISGIVAASERTTLWREDAHALLLSFAADCAERALVIAQTRLPHTECDGRTHVQTDLGLPAMEPAAGPDGYEALALMRAYLSGEATDSAVSAFEETIPKRMRWTGFRGAWKAHNAALYLVQGITNFAAIDCAVFDAADAISYDADGLNDSVAALAVYRAERLRQGKLLHARLKTLAPTGYTEPEGTWDWDVLTDEQENQNV